MSDESNADGHGSEQDPAAARRRALAGLVAPRDPRTDLPAFGTLATTASLDEVVTRVVAPNPSPMTLDGTNTYVVGTPGSGEVVVVDPGPADADHLARVEAVVAERDAAVAMVVATHHHRDHSEAVRDWASHFGAVPAAPTADVAGPTGTVVADGDEVGPAGARLVAVATPGHCADHVAYRVGTGALLVGDHVLGRGTSVVAYPDGDLAAYLDSLVRVQRLGPDALFPGHGPEVADGPGEVLAYYAAHRAFREQQVLAVLGVGPASPRQIVEAVYAQVDPVLWGAAEASTRAALAKLEDDGMVRLRAGVAQLATERDH